MALDTAQFTDGDAIPAYTPEVAERTAPLYERVKDVIPEIEWPTFAPYVDEINRLKKQMNAAILVHNYMTPEIFHCVGDFTGDSLQLAREAAESKAELARDPRGCNYVALRGRRGGSAIASAAVNALAAGLPGE